MVEVSGISCELADMRISAKRSRSTAASYERRSTPRGQVPRQVPCSDCCCSCQRRDVQHNRDCMSTVGGLEAPANIRKWSSIEQTAKSSIQEKKIRVTFLPADGTASTPARGNRSSTLDEDVPPAYSSPVSNAATPGRGVAVGSVSTIGQSLSGYIQREIVARTPLQDCRSHARTWDILRLTRMPVAQVDVGYITSPHDRALLADGVVRDTIADAILVAVKRLYLLGEDDRPTGTYTFADLLASEQVAR